MKLKIRAAVLACLAAAAVYFGVIAVKSVHVPKSETPDYYIQNTPSPDKAAYIIRDCDGFIGVYSPKKSSNPVDITDIQTSHLRDTDRKLLKEGIPVSSKEELLTLLEDFGS